MYNYTFQASKNVKIPFEHELAGIDNAAAAGLDPVKVNMVVKRGMNDHGIEAMAEYFRGSGHVLRFIEFMDVGNTNRSEEHTSELQSRGHIVCRLLLEK